MGKHVFWPFALLAIFGSSCLFAQDLLPEEIRIGDKTYAVALEKSDAREHLFVQLIPPGYRFSKEEAERIADKDFRDRYGYLPESFRNTLLRSPDGRYGLPFHGHATMLWYVDTRERRLVYLDKAFPPLEGSGYYNWVGYCRNELEMPSDYLLYVSHWDREHQTHKCVRATIPLRSPEKLRVEPMDDVAVQSLLARVGNAIPAIVEVGRQPTWAILAADTGKLKIKGLPAKNEDAFTMGRVSHVALSPDGSKAFVIHRKGLTVYSAADGRELAQFEGVGYPLNAASLGTLFDPTGTVASVSTPYSHRLTLIDVKTLRTIATYKSPQPLAGLEFSKEDNQAIAHVTTLPFE